MTAVACACDFVGIVVARTVLLESGMKNIKRKLQLDRETILRLTGDDLARVAGGDTPGTSGHFTSQDSLCSQCRWFCHTLPERQQG